MANPITIPGGPTIPPARPTPTVPAMGYPKMGETDEEKKMRLLQSLDETGRTAPDQPVKTFPATFEDPRTRETDEEKRLRMLKELDETGRTSPDAPVKTLPDFADMTPRRPQAQTSNQIPSERAPQAQAMAEKVIAQNPEKAQDPDWLSKMWEGVVKFFGTPQAADDLTMWDILEGATKGYAGNFDTSRKARIDKAREERLIGQEAQREKEAQEAARKFQGQEGALERAAALERAKIAAAGDAAGGFGGLNPAIVSLLEKYGAGTGEGLTMEMPAGEQVGGAQPMPWDGIDFSKIPGEVGKYLQERPGEIWKWVQANPLQAAAIGLTAPISAPLAAGLGAANATGLLPSVNPGAKK